MTAFSGAAIRNLKVEARPCNATDGGGLFCGSARLGAKAWRFAYRFSGRSKRLCLGSYPDGSLKRARKLTAEARAQGAGDALLAERCGSGFDKPRAGKFGGPALTCLLPSERGSLAAWLSHTQLLLPSVQKQVPSTTPQHGRRRNAASQTNAGRASQERAGGACPTALSAATLPTSRCSAGRALVMRRAAINSAMQRAGCPSSRLACRLGSARIASRARPNAFRRNGGTQRLESSPSSRMVL